MTQEQPPLEPHRTAEAYARRLRFGEQFDRGALTGEEALQDALLMVEELKRDPRWQPHPALKR